MEDEIVHRNHLIEVTFRVFVDGDTHWPAATAMGVAENIDAAERSGHTPPTIDEAQLAAQMVAEQMRASLDNVPGARVALAATDVLNSAIITEAELAARAADSGDRQHIMSDVECHRLFDPRGVFPRDHIVGTELADFPVTVVAELLDLVNGFLENYFSGDGDNNPTDLINSAGRLLEDRGIDWYQGPSDVIAAVRFLVNKAKANPDQYPQSTVLGLCTVGETIDKYLGDAASDDDEVSGLAESVWTSMDDIESAFFNLGGEA